MTIECHLSRCSYHSCHEPGQEGPFCDEQKCRVAESELEILQRKRKERLTEEKRDESCS